VGLHKDFVQYPVNGISHESLRNPVKENGPEGDVNSFRTLGIDAALSRTDATGALTYLPDALGSTLALADSGGAPSTTFS